MKTLKTLRLDCKGQGSVIDAFIWVIAAVLMVYVAFMFIDQMNTNMNFRVLIQNLGNPAMTLVFYDLIPPVLMLSIPLGIIILIRLMQNRNQPQY